MHCCPQPYCFAWPEYMCVKMIDAVNKNVKPYAEDAGDKHLQEAGLVGYANYLHQPTEETPQWIRSRAPEKSQHRPDEERMAIPMGRISKSEYGYNQDLNVNNHIGKDEYRDVEPFPEYQPNKNTRSKMIWSKRHRVSDQQ